ncbi:MAG TPA: amidohydrolase family protein [Granulicella sp.]|nr:amidohydrolase family protein [Granulicella sp.]
MSTDKRSSAPGAQAAAGTAPKPGDGAEAQPAGKRPYKIITTEEGFIIPEVVEAQARYTQTATDELGIGWTSVLGRFPALIDWNSRISDMDRDGVDTQLLLLAGPGVQILSPNEGTALARLTNDRATEEAVRKYPGRFALLAAVAPQDPGGAAKELERAVTKLGAKGGVINGHTKGEYLDEDKFMPIFEAAESLDVPIYIHPREPSPQMLAPYQKWGLETAVWGFAAEVSLHVLRMIWAGVFDRYPKLKIVIGHAGENLPFALDRLDTTYRNSLVFPAKSAVQEPVAAKRLPSEYFHENIYCTTSGINWAPTVTFMQKVLGAERVLFAVDYPFTKQPWEIERAEGIAMSDADRKLFFQTNAEKVFKLV